MAAKSALIISLGTGIGPNGPQSLASAVALSVNSSAAEKVLFVVSRQSREKLLPLVSPQIARDYEVCEVDDTEDINQIYDRLAQKFKEMRSAYENLVVDYTSGTKAMTGALAVLGCVYEADALSYVTGERHEGVVVRGTEKLLTLRPYYILAERRLGEAISLFNHCQFDAAILVVSQVETASPVPKILEKLSPLKSAAQAYSAWDRFDHKSAFEKLKTIVMPIFNDNKAFLGRLLHAGEREPYLIADLLNNAQRRGEIEQKYDDAVARLYRTTELIAQYRLKGFGIDDTGNVPGDKIPESLRGEIRPENGRIKLGLHKSYGILAALGDEVGQRYREDRQLQDLLRKRNSSVLAHGLVPVEKDQYVALKDKVVGYAKETVPSLDRMMSESTFIEWPE